MAHMISTQSQLSVGESRAQKGCSFSGVNPARVPGSGPYQLFPCQGPHIGWTLAQIA